MRHAAPYRPRPIRLIDRWTTHGHRLKVYEIVHAGAHAAPALVAAAKRLAEDALGRLPGAHDDARVGFVGVHDGRGADFVFLGLWTNENELRHLVWTTPDKDPAKLARVPWGEPDVCVWDLALLSRERDAFVRHILSRPGGPSLDAYLLEACDGEA